MFCRQLSEMHFILDPPPLAEMSPEDARQEFAGADIRMRDTDYFPFLLRNVA